MFENANLPGDDSLPVKILDCAPRRGVVLEVLEKSVLLCTSFFAPCLPVCRAAELLPCAKMLTAVACRLGLSSLVSREQERSKVAGQTVKTGPLLPAAKPYLIENLSTPQLQMLAAFAGATTLPINQRSTLLNVVNTHVEALACKAWHVKNVEVLVLH